MCTTGDVIPTTSLLRGDEARFEALGGDQKETLVEVENMAENYAEIMRKLLVGECSEQFLKKTKIDRFLHYMFFAEPDRTKKICSQ